MIAEKDESRGYEMNRTKALVEGAITAAIFTIILMITWYVPVLGIVSLWFLPLPIIYYIARQGAKNGIVVLAAAVVVSLILVGLVAGILAVYFLVMGAIMGFLLYRKKSAFAILLGGSLANAAMMLIAYGVSISIFHFNPVHFLQDTLNHSLQLTKTIGKSIGQDPSKQLKQWKALVTLLPSYIPFLIITWSVLHALIVELVSTPVLRRLRVDFPQWPPFRDWRFPKSIIWYYLATLIVMIAANPQQGDWLFPVVLNLYQLLETAMLIQGFSFIFYFAHIKGWGKTLPVLAVVFGVIVQPLLYIIKILGIIDLGFDLRSRLKKK